MTTYRWAWLRSTGPNKMPPRTGSQAGPYARDHDDADQPITTPARTRGLTRAAASTCLLVIVMFLALGRSASAEADPRRSVAVLEFRSGAADLPAMSMRIADVLRKKTSLGVLDVDEARRRGGDQLDKQIAECAGEARCIAGIGKGLGASEVLLVGISRFGDVILTLQRIDTEGEVLARIAEAMAPGTSPSDRAVLAQLMRLMPKNDFYRFGLVRIEASIAGATVLIDGTPRGKTPLGPIRVSAPANHEIQLSKSGYTPFMASLFVPPDAEVEVRPQLTAAESVWYKRWWVMGAAGVLAASAITVAIISSDGSSDVPVRIGPF